jgi:tetratricopeptide (TPR) repeat protein
LQVPRAGSVAICKFDWADTIRISAIFNRFAKIHLPKDLTSFDRSLASVAALAGSWYVFGWNPKMRTVTCTLMLFILANGLYFSVPDEPRSLESLLAQAAQRIRSNDLTGAETILRDGLSALGDLPDLLKVLGTVYQRQQRFQESIDVFRKVLKRAPVYPEVNLFMGISYYALNQFNDAVTALNAELAANPKDRESRYYLALALDASDRKFDAIAQLEKLLVDNPQDTQALYQLVRSYKAATHGAFNRLSKLAPQSDFLLALRAEANAENEKSKEAIEQYKQVLVKNPEFPGIHFALGEICWKLARYEEAMKELQLSLDEDPSHPIGNYYVGDILVKELKYEDAISHLRLAVAGDPKLMQAHFLLGKCYITTGKLQDALRHLLKAEELAPENTSTHYQLSQVYARLEEKDKSQKHLEIFGRLTRESKAQTEKTLQLSNDNGLEKAAEPARK